MDRPAVILLHSSASSARQWELLAAALRPAFDVHAIDLHGHGERAAWRGPAPLALADDAALAEPVLRRCGSAHLVGHSYGAAVAIKLATLQPQRVASLVTYEPVMFGWLRDIGERAVDDASALARTIRELLRAGLDAVAAQRFVDFWSGAGSWARLSPGAQAAVARRMSAVDAHFEALFDDPMTTSAVAAAGVPMLCLAGADTVPVTRRIAGLMRQALPAARHETLPGMGHLGPITHAAAVASRIESFLQDAGNPHGQARCNRYAATVP